MKMASIFSIAAVPTIALLALLPGQGAAQQKTLKEQLFGTWTFVSTTGKLADGTPIWGTNPKGLLIFTDNGRYSSSIIRTDVQNFAAKNRLQGTPDENKAAVHGGIGTFGTYTVNEVNKTFTVHFEHVPEQYGGRADAAIYDHWGRTEDQQPGVLGRWAESLCENGG